MHVGQSDIPVDVCRKFLGEDSIVGLSANTQELITAADASQIDYFGVGALHATSTKTDAEKVLSFDELAQIAKISPRPIVVGGGVKLDDIAKLAATKVNGFFVVSAVTGAENPRLAARELVTAWKKFA